MPAEHPGRGRIFRFGDFEFDENALRLKRDGQPVEISTTPLRVLLCLVTHHPQVVPKALLLREVWENVRVSDWALSTALKEVRKVLGDDGQQQRWIRTERRRGYQFVPPVMRSEVPTSGCAGRVIGSLRGPSMSFVGRDDELRRLEALLLQDSYVGVHVAIEGLAGVGKTELALQLVHKLTHDGSLPGGVFWLSAEREDLTAAWGHDLADRAGLPQGSPQERCAGLLRRIEDTRQLTLIVLDNVTSWSTTQRPQPLPTGSHVRVLATTRTRTLGGSAFHHLELDLLTPPSDGDLLRALVGRDPGVGTEELLRELAGHTLAIEIAASFLHTYRGETAQSCLEALRKTPADVDRSIRDRLGYERTIEGAYRTAWDRLSKAERQAWQTAACFRNEPASLALLHASGVSADSVRALEDLHLVSCSPDGCWSMHRLTRAFALHAQQEGLETARRAFVAGCAAGAAGLFRPDGLRAYATDRVHFDVALELAPEVLDPKLELRLLLAVGGGLMLQDAYSPEHVAALYERTLDVARGEKRPRDIMAAIEGLWTHQVLRSAWHEAQETALAARDAASADGLPNHRIASLAMYAGAIFPQGRISEALALVEQAFALFELHPFELPRQIAWEPRMSALWTGSTAACLLGLPGRGLRLSEEISVLARFMQHPVSLGIAAFASAMIHQLTGSIDAVERDAAELFELGTQHRLPMFRSLGTIMNGWAQIATGRPRQARAWQAMREEMDVLLRSRVASQKMYLLTLLAETAIAADLPTQALRTLEQALALGAQSGEVIYLPELWRLRARCEDSPQEALACLARAIRSAEQLEAHWWRLRACTDLCERLGSRSAETDAAETAHTALRAALALVQGGDELPELRRARAALAAVRS